MAVTYQNLLDGARRMLGRLGSGDSATSTEDADHLIVLNEMLDSWSAKLGPILFETTDTLTWTSGQSSRTIGVSGNFDVSRPVDLISAFYRRDSITDLPIEIVTYKQYQAIIDKALSQSFPQQIAYNPTYASGLGTLFLWPVPSSDTTILLTSRKPIAAIAALSDTVVLPPGHQKAIRYGLAVALAPEYGVRLAEIPEIVSEAKSALQDIISMGDTVESIILDPLAPGQPGGFSDVDLYTKY